MNGWTLAWWEAPLLLAHCRLHWLRIETLQNLARIEAGKVHA